MRTTLLTLTTALALASCAPDNREVPVESLVIRQQLIHEIDTDDPFTGLAVNPQLPAKATYKDGLPDGPFEFYYGNGQLMARAAVRLRGRDSLALFRYMRAGAQVHQDQAPYVIKSAKGLQEEMTAGIMELVENGAVGPFEFYEPNGQLIIKGAYKDGEPDGPFEDYHSNGQLREKATFKDGQPDGPYESYYSDGQLREKGINKEGELHGTKETYHSNGQLKEKADYKNGQPDGAFESYYSNGQLAGKGAYRDGQLHGTQETYHSNGQLEKTETYEEGELHGTKETYHSNGQLKEKADYKNGQMDGPAEFYHSNGQLEKSETYKEGQLHGTRKSYYENGQLREEANYENGQREGAYETYHSNGQLREKGTVKEGQPDGPFESYAENGQPREKKTYASGQLDGVFESYGENGHLREKKTYKEGRLDGPYESYYSDGQIQVKGTRKGEQSWDGAYESYFESGRPREKRTYKGERLDGPYEFYYSGGQLRRRENYKDGDREGLAQNYDENGQLLKLDLPAMVGIPARSFQMGCVSGLNCRNSERPVRTVTISQPFALSKYEVTFSQWEACVLVGGCNGHRPDDEGWGHGDRPVINVSWQDAQTYVSWLSRETGEDYRLPSEAEWEYAARAGSTTKYSWGNEMSRDRANCGQRRECRNRWNGSTAPVGSFPANDFGLHDMHGNVWEWVEDCWNESYTGAPSNGGAWLRGNCDRRVMRSGSWNNAPRSLRSASRGRIATDFRGIYVGFRVALTRNP